MTDDDLDNWLDRANALEVDDIEPDPSGITIRWMFELIEDVEFTEPNCLMRFSEHPPLCNWPDYHSGSPCACLVNRMEQFDTSFAEWEPL